jgi:hypothetical protein
MPKRAVVVAITGGLAIIGVGVADAAKQHVHTLNITIQSTVLSSQGKPPISGSETQVGIIKGSFGDGAGPATLTFVMPGHANIAFTWFFAKGSFRGTVPTVGMQNPDGSASISGSGRVSSGTGVYDGAKGNFTLTATTPRGSSITTLRVRGKVKF